MELIVDAGALPRLVRDRLSHAAPEAARLVRCRDCVRNAPSRLGDGWCLHLRRKVGAEWFCADGKERKGHAD